MSENPVHPVFFVITYVKYTDTKLKMQAAKPVTSETDEAAMMAVIPTAAADASPYEYEIEKAA